MIKESCLYHVQKWIFELVRHWKKLIDYSISNSSDPFWYLPANVSTFHSLWSKNSSPALQKTPPLSFMGFILQRFTERIWIFSRGKINYIKKPIWKKTKLKFSLGKNMNILLKIRSRKFWKSFGTKIKHPFRQVASAPN